MYKMNLSESIKWGPSGLDEVGVLENLELKFVLDVSLLTVS